VLRKSKEKLFFKFWCI